MGTVHRTTGRRGPILTSPSCISLADAHPLRVLIVDDDRAHRCLLRGILQAFGYDASEAQDGAEAHEASLAGAFDLVIMDLDMPVLDGIVATRRILRDAPWPPRVVGLTGAAVLEGTWREAGMAALLTKPPDPVELQAQLLRAPVGPATQP